MNYVPLLFLFFWLLPLFHYFSLLERWNALNAPDFEQKGRARYVFYWIVLYYTLNVHASQADKFMPLTFTLYSIVNLHFGWPEAKGGFTLIWIGTVWSRHLIFPVKTIGQPLPIRTGGSTFFYKKCQISFFNASHRYVGGPLVIFHPCPFQDLTSWAFWTNFWRFHEKTFDRLFLIIFLRKKFSSIRLIAIFRLFGVIFCHISFVNSEIVCRMNQTR